MSDITKSIMERGTDESLVDDSDILGRMEELYVSSCQHGCKHYMDPETGLVVLSHSSNYGCRIRKADLLKNRTTNA
uniref:Uncharacterized protein n=1 Tax=Gordonia phage Petito TaxID=3158876 RepID=A0AAU8GPR0_9CAUD